LAEYIKPKIQRQHLFADLTKYLISACDNLFCAPLKDKKLYLWPERTFIDLVSAGGVRQHPGLLPHHHADEEEHLQVDVAAEYLGGISPDAKVVFVLVSTWNLVKKCKLSIM
jgi:hypothetical protein